METNGVALNTYTYTILIKACEGKPEWYSRYITIQTFVRRNIHS